MMNHNAFDALRDSSNVSKKRKFMFYVSNVLALLIVLI